jgi:hypothetical protein
MEMSDTVIEWAPFQVRPGIDEKMLLKLSEELQSGFLARQKGYLRRELVKGKEDGAYVDIVWWASMEDAEAAMAHVADSPACSAYFAAMTPESMDAAAGVLHYRLVKHY